MSRDILADRGKGLEESFFAKQNEALRQRLRDREETKKRKAALATTFGVADDIVLEALVALDFSTDTLTALSPVPLVAVAWADGEIDHKERCAILSASAEMGLSNHDPGSQRVEQWLVEPPAAELLVAWKHYVRARLARLSPEAQHAMKSELLDRARAVAAITGGFLGIGPRISVAEEAVLEELERAFPFHNEAPLFE